MTDKAIPVKVALRIRPLSNKEIDEGCQAVVQVRRVHVILVKKLN